MNLNLIPSPQQITLHDGQLSLVTGIRIRLESNDPQDHFAATYLMECLENDHQLTAHIESDATNTSATSSNADPLRPKATASALRVKAF